MIKEKISKNMFAKACLDILEFGLSAEVWEYVRSPFTCPSFVIEESLARITGKECSSCDVCGSSSSYCEKFLYAPIRSVLCLSIPDFVEKMFEAGACCACCPCRLVGVKVAVKSAWIWLDEEFGHNGLQSIADTSWKDLFEKEGWL